MTDELLPFMQFHDPVPARGVADRLAAAGITSVVQDNRHRFDVSFAYNTIDPTVQLLVAATDFPRARASLERYFRNHLAEVDSDYYLYAFSDAELGDVVSRPDEWGPLDYPLARQILKDRGLEVPEASAEEWKQNRLVELAQPLPVDPGWIRLGFVVAFAGGLFGLVMGSVLLTHRKILPDGSRVFAYPASDRRRAKYMIACSCIGMGFWWWIRFGH